MTLYICIITNRIISIINSDIGIKVVLKLRDHTGWLILEFDGRSLHKKGNQMKKLIFVLISGIICTFSQAQINLIGTVNGGLGTMQIAEWQALDTSSLVLHATNLQSYLYGSSVYDAWNGNYYLTGEITNSGFGLFSFNSVTNQQGFNPFSSFSNITEIDMSTAKIYTLTMEGADTIRVNEYDIATGNTILLGVICEPGLQGIITEATGFDSNRGILYYVGFSGNSQRLLYGIHVRDQVFNYSTVLLTTPSAYANLTCINYDNLNDKLYGLMTTYDSTWAFSANSVAEIDYISGTVSKLGELTGFTGFVGGSSSFDQLTGSFLLAGVDTSLAIQMIVFNTYDSSFVTGYIPDGVSEIVCDNYAYTRSVYTSVDGHVGLQERLKVFPVPARDQLSVELPGPGELRITDSNGDIVFSQQADDLHTVIRLAGIPAGFYIIESRNAEQISRSRFIKVN